MRAHFYPKLVVSGAMAFVMLFAAVPAIAEEESSVGTASATMAMTPEEHLAYGEDEASVEEATTHQTISISDFARLHKGDLASGTYRFAPIGRAEASVDLRYGDVRNGAALQIWSENGTDAQVWRVEVDDEGYATVISALSGKYLQSVGYSGANGTRLQLWDETGEDCQKWVFVKCGESYSLVSALATSVEIDAEGGLVSAQVVDLPGGATTDGTPLQLWTSNGTQAQRFTVTTAKPRREVLNDLARANAGVIDDGIYAVCSSSRPRGVLDVSGGSYVDGANVQLWGSNATAAQRWSVVHDDKGYVTLTNVKSGKVLDVSGASSSAGANVQQWVANESWAQKWIVVPRGDGSMELRSALRPNLTLDLSGGATRDGANVQVWDVNGSYAQAFSMSRTDEVIAPGERAENLEGTWLSLEPTCASGKVLDVACGSTRDGANVQLYSSNGSPAQAWMLEWQEGYYRLVNSGSAKYLDIAEGDAVPGANVQQWSRALNDHQLFALSKNGDGTYTFVNKATGLALGIAGTSFSDGANLEGQVPNGSEAQAFILTNAVPSLPEDAYVITSVANSSVALDVRYASTADGADVQAYIANGTYAQKWYVSPAAGSLDERYIENICSAKRLSVDGNGNVCQSSASDDASQRWRIAFSLGGYAIESVARPGEVLDFSNETVSNGVNALIRPASGAPSQCFNLANTDAHPSAGTYFICGARDDRFVLDVLYGSHSNGANVQYWENNGSGAQKWCFSCNSDGTYTVVNAMTGKALDVKNAVAADGANVQQWEANWSLAQKWYISYRPGGFRLASALDPSLVLGADGPISQGVNAQLTMGAGKAIQGFTLKQTTYLPPEQQAMALKAQNYHSATNWLILVDITQNRVGIFNGSLGNWRLENFWLCSSGAPNTPTRVGQFTVGNKGYSFGENHGYSCYYWTQFYADYLFHSVKYYAGTRRIMDGRLGMNISAGCVRMQIDQAKWIYDNIPRGTKVVVYR